MSSRQADARIRELQFLAEIENNLSRGYEQTASLDQTEKMMIAQLVFDGHLNGVGLQQQSWTHSEELAINVLKASIEREKWKTLVDLASGQSIRLQLTHKGLVRISELRQQLRTGRDREPFGILLGQRHVVPDLAIAITSASTAAPLSVAYLDANGFKAINDLHNHAAGDDALKILMAVVSERTTDPSEAYRAGGDELVVIMPNTTTEKATSVVLAIARKLHQERIPHDMPLSVSCGVATTIDSNEGAGSLLRSADEQQKRAKAESRVDSPRPSVICSQGSEPVVIPLRKG